MRLYLFKSASKLVRLALVYALFFLRTSRNDSLDNQVECFLLYLRMYVGVLRLAAVNNMFLKIDQLSATESEVKSMLSTKVPKDSRKRSKFALLKL